MKEIPMRSASVSKSIGSTSSSMICVSTYGGIEAATQRLESMENRRKREPRGRSRPRTRHRGDVGFTRMNLIRFTTHLLPHSACKVTRHPTRLLKRYCRAPDCTCMKPGKRLPDYAIIWRPTAQPTAAPVTGDGPTVTTRQTLGHTYAAWSAGGYFTPFCPSCLKVVARIQTCSLLFLGEGSFFCIKTAKGRLVCLVIQFAHESDFSQSL